MTLSGAFSHRGRCLAVSVWIMKIVMTICSGASRDNYHKPHGPSTDQNTSILLWNQMIYPLAGLSFFKGKTFYWLATVRTLASECQRWNNSCCSSPRPNWPRPPRPAPAWWRRPPPAWAGSPQCYLCSKFLHKIVIGPRDPNKTINTQLVTRLTLAISPHRILRSNSLCVGIFDTKCVIFWFWTPGWEWQWGCSGCRENEGGLWLQLGCQCPGWQLST